MPRVELLKHHQLHGDVQAGGGQQLAHEHRQAAIATQRHHLAVGSAELRADRLGHGVRHRAVAERCEEPSTWRHLQVPRAPDVAHPGVDREDRVLGGEIADGRCDHLGPEAFAAAFMGHVGLELLHRASVVGKHVVEERPVLLLGDARQKRPKRLADVADKPKVHLGAATEVPWRDVNLHDRGVVRHEIAEREVGPEQQQQVAFGECPDSAALSQETGHAHGIGIVGLEDVLAAIRVGDGRVQQSGKLQHFAPRSATTVAAVDRDSLALRDEPRELIEVGVGRPDLRAFRGQWVAEQRGLDLHRADVAGQDDHPDAVLEDRGLQRKLGKARHLFR
jgi:hypothetical protein